MMKWDTIVLLLIVFCRAVSAMEQEKSSPIPFLVTELKEQIFHEYQLACGKQFIPPYFYFKEGKSHAYIEQPLPEREFPHQRHGLYEIHAGLPGIKKISGKKFRTYYCSESHLPQQIPLFSERRIITPQITNYLPVPVWTLINQNGFVALNVHHTDAQRNETFYLINVDKKAKQSPFNYLFNLSIGKIGNRIPLESNEYLATTISPTKEMVVALSKDPAMRQKLFWYTFLDNKRWQREEITFKPDYSVRSVWWGPSNSIIAYLLKSKEIPLFQLANESSVESCLTIYNTKQKEFHHEIDLSEWINSESGNHFFNNAVAYYRSQIKLDEIDQVNAILPSGKRPGPLINNLKNLYQTDRFVEIQFSVEVSFGKKITVHDFLTIFPSYVLYDYQAKQLLSITTPTLFTDLVKQKKHHKITIKSYEDLKKMVFFFIDNPHILLLIDQAYTWLHNKNRSINDGREILRQLHNKAFISNKWLTLWAATVGKKYKDNYFRKIHELVNNRTNDQSAKNRS